MNVELKTICRQSAERKDAREDAILKSDEKKEKHAKTQPLVLLDEDAASRSFTCCSDCESLVLNSIMRNSNSPSGYSI